MTTTKLVPALFGIALNALAGGALACVGNVVYYGLLSRGGKAAMIVPLTALYPLVTILLAMLLLKERLNRIQTAGLLLSLIAIYLFNVQREEGFFSKWLVYALAPIVLWGLAGLLQKVSTNHISGELSTLWFLAAFIPVAVVILVREPLPAPVAPHVWLLVIAQGFFLALGNFAVLAAFADVLGRLRVGIERNAEAGFIDQAGRKDVGVGNQNMFHDAKLLVQTQSTGQSTLDVGILLALVSVAALCCQTQPRDQAQAGPAAKTDVIA